MREIVRGTYIKLTVGLMGFFFRSKLEIKRRLGILAKEYVDFTNDILQKYSFFKDGSFVKLFIKRIKVIQNV